jgi:hypothetical protein
MPKGKKQQAEANEAVTNNKKYCEAEDGVLPSWRPGRSTAAKDTLRVVEGIETR